MAQPKPVPTPPQPPKVERQAKPAAQPKSKANLALDGLVEIGQPWWKRYSAHGEFPWSTVTSLVFHAFLVVLILVLSKRMVTRDPLPPAVDSIVVGDDSEAPAGDPGPGEGPGKGDGLPVEDTPAKPEEKLPDTPPKELPKTDVQKVAPDPKDLMPPLPDPNAQPPPDKDDDKAFDRIKEIRERLANNIGAKSSKKGTGPAGGGAGGSGAKGRGARPARWVLRFSTSSAQNYLAQLDGLGATVAFPLRGDKYLYFYNASSSDRRSEQRDLANDNRLYWIDGKPESVQRVTQFLGDARVARAPCMVAFLPVELEDRMLKLELAYQNRQEDEILSTEFEVVTRGGKYDVFVARQTLK